LRSLPLLLSLDEQAADEFWREFSLENGSKSDSGASSSSNVLFCGFFLPRRSGDTSELSELWEEARRAFFFTRCLLFELPALLPLGFLHS
jgi:hypothetical protein